MPLGQFCPTNEMMYLFLHVPFVWIIPKVVPLEHFDEISFFFFSIAKDCKKTVLHTITSTVKILINSRAFIRIITFHENGDGVYCSSPWR